MAILLFWLKNVAFTQHYFCSLGLKPVKKYVQINDLFHPLSTVPLILNYLISFRKKMNVANLPFYV